MAKMTALPSYPTDIDPELMDIAFKAMTGVFPDPHKAVHALYCLEGYVLGKVYNDPSSPPIVMFEKSHDMKALPPGTWLKILQSIFQALLTLAPLIVKPAQ